MADDADLARRAATGDQSAAGEIYDRYAPLVRAILFEATGSLAEANDLLHEVFLRALLRLGQLRRGELLCGWLVGIARNEGTEYRRQMAKRRRRFLALSEDSAQTKSDDSRNETVQETTERVREAIREIDIEGKTIRGKNGGRGVAVFRQGTRRDSDRGSARLATRKRAEEAKELDRRNPSPRGCGG